MDKCKIEGLRNSPDPTEHIYSEGAGASKVNVPKKYQAELFYGYQECESGIYHAFELTDPEACADEGKIVVKLAELLDTKPENEDFNYNSMYVALPESLVNRIRAEAVKEFLEEHGKAGDRPADICV